MTTNREWLYSLDVADLADWFDAEHVEHNERDERKAKAKSILNAESYKFASEPDAESYIDCGKVENDSREKLEADVYRAADEMEEFTHGEKFINTNKILRWLNRQAAITAEETSGAWEEYRDATQREIAELTAQVDELAQQLTNARADCEQYRELFSKAITQAAEIVNLQP